MSDDEIWSRDQIQSPCIRICVIHPDTRLCTGCLRTIDEITDWTKMPPEQRTQIMAELPARAPQHAQRRGGRKARLERR